MGRAIVIATETDKPLERIFFHNPHPLAHSSVHILILYAIAEHLDAETSKAENPTLPSKNQKFLTANTKFHSSHH